MLLLLTMILFFLGNCEKNVRSELRVGFCRQIPLRFSAPCGCRPSRYLKSVFLKECVISVLGGTFLYYRDFVSLLLPEKCLRCSRAWWALRKLPRPVQTLFCRGYLHRMKTPILNAYLAWGFWDLIGSLIEGWPSHRDQLVCPNSQGFFPCDLLTAKCCCSLQNPWIGGGILLSGFPLC